MKLPGRKNDKGLAPKANPVKTTVHPGETLLQPVAKIKLPKTTVHPGETLLQPVAKIKLPKTSVPVLVNTCAELPLGNAPPITREDVMEAMRRPVFLTGRRGNKMYFEPARSEYRVETTAGETYRSHQIDKVVEKVNE